nr:hypothetical protein [Halomicroarcula marina]
MSSSPSNGIQKRHWRPGTSDSSSSALVASNSAMRSVWSRSVTVALTSVNVTSPTFSTTPVTPTPSAVS